MLLGKKKTQTRLLKVSLCSKRTNSTLKYTELMTAVILLSFRYYWCWGRHVTVLSYKHKFYSKPSKVSHKEPGPILVTAAITRAMKQFGPDHIACRGAYKTQNTQIFWCISTVLKESLDRDNHIRETGANLACVFRWLNRCCSINLLHKYWIIHFSCISKMFLLI